MIVPVPAVDLSLQARNQNNVLVVIPKAELNKKNQRKYVFVAEPKQFMQSNVWLVVMKRKLPDAANAAWGYLLPVPKPASIVGFIKTLKSLENALITKEPGEKCTLVVLHAPAVTSFCITNEILN
jgi:hypothetical protein